MSIDRRSLLAMLMAVSSPPLLAQSAPRRIAWFGAGRSGVPTRFFEAFRSGMRELGWIEGQNLTISMFLAEGSIEESERLARQMLATQPELIVTHGREAATVHRVKPPGTVAFAFSGDPVDAGFVQSYARSGTNFAGVSFLSLELAGKRVELLKEIMPRLRRFAVLTRPEHPGEHRERAVSEEVIAKMGLSMAYVAVRTAAGLDEAFETITRQNCDALIAFPDALTLDNSARIAKFAAEAKIATVSGWAAYAENGFLLSYGPNLGASYRRLAHYANRLLRGEKPADLPVELPSVVEMVLNAHTAKTLGVTIPHSILLRADRVIE